MKNIFFQLRNSIIGFLYRNFFKKILFKIDEEKIHDNIIRLGKFLGSNILFRKTISLSLNFSDPMLEQNIGGIFFKNPVGLAAGFDKNAELTEIAPSLGLAL